jgi:ClpP class serine protease
MGSNNQGEDKRRRREALWRRIRDAIYKAVNEVFRPLPPDVIEKIEDVLGRAERDFKDEEEKGQCLDDDSEKR